MDVRRKSATANFSPVETFPTVLVSHRTEPFFTNFSRFLTLCVQRNAEIIFLVIITVIMINYFSKIVIIFDQCNFCVYLGRILHELVDYLALYQDILLLKVVLAGRGIRLRLLSRSILFRIGQTNREIFCPNLKRIGN